MTREQELEFRRISKIEDSELQAKRFYEVFSLEDLINYTVELKQKIGELKLKL